MEVFKHLFLTACTEINVKPDMRVLAIIEESQVDGKCYLNFSECSLNLETCRALGLAFMKDVLITHLDFSNCMLHEEGLIELLKGLMSNKTVIFLKLMGNNIRSSGTLVLGKLLQLNSHLQQLNLDWNSMGILPDKFFAFCEGLAHNNTLKELDLGHNQLNNQCASALAYVILKNTCLEVLGLQFNNFGSVGGTSLLKALVQNITLVQMNVEGNNMGVVTVNSIEIAISRNFDRKITRQRHAEEARVLANKLQEVENEKNMQLKMLAEALKKKENEISSNEKLNSMKITQLESKLADRDAAFDMLNSKCKQLEISLCSAESKLNALSDLLNKMETENSDLRLKHNNILSNERKERYETESQLQKEICTYKDHILLLEKQVEDMDQKVMLQENMIQKLNEANSKLEKHLTSRETEFNDHLEILKERHAQTLKNIENLRQKDVARLNNEYSNMEQHFSQRIQNLEHQKIQLEMEVGELKGIAEREKLQKEELLEQQQQKLKAEETKFKKQMEEKVSLIEAAKNKQEINLKEREEEIQELQTKNTALTLEIAEQSHEVKHLQQCLRIADDECKVQVSKVRLEVKEKLEEFNSVKENNKQLSSEISFLKKQIEDLKVAHLQEVKLRDEKVQQVKEEFVLQGKKLQMILEDDAKRANQLQAAFMSYFSNVQQVTSNLS